MSVYWLAPLIAVAILLALAQGAVALTGAVRRHDFRRFEDRSRASFAQKFPLPKVEPSRAEERRKAVSPFLATMHNATNAAQNTYHNAVVRSTGCLAVAFLALVLDTSLHDLPSTNWLSVYRHLVEDVLIWVDAIAFIFVLILFFYARSASQCWIVARVGAELLRQYQFLNVVFPDASAAPKTDEVKAQFNSQADAIRTCVQEGSTTGIISRIEGFWLQHKVSIEKRALAESDISADALLVYLERRARRQLGWFADSKARLEHIAERRNFVLLFLYAIAAGFAISKLVLFLYCGRSPAYLLALLLIVTGMSAAVTAYYINQNARSLIHRYNTQMRRITKWLKEFDDRWNFAELPSLTFNADAKTTIRTLILQLEALMIEELIDWVHITTYDAIELAP